MQASSDTVEVSAVSLSTDREPVYVALAPAGRSGVPVVFGPSATSRPRIPIQSTTASRKPTETQKTGWAPYCLKRPPPSRAPARKMER